MRVVTAVYTSERERESQFPIGQCRRTVVVDRRETGFTFSYLNKVKASIGEGGIRSW